MTDISYEIQLFQKYESLAGIDEAGRGPLAGPVVTACVVLKNPIKQIDRVTDSKLLSEAVRTELFDLIIQESHEYSITIATPAEIDQLNILNATQLAMNRAVKVLENKPNIVLVDGKFSKPFGFNSECIVKGDLKHYSIAAASILAKVYRDNLMNEFDSQFPEYGFAQHKGYSTKQHREALDRYGLCPIHRKSFLQQLRLI